MKFLIIVAGEQRGHARGVLNRTLGEYSKGVLEEIGHEVVITFVSDGYNKITEQEKFKASDVIIFHFPVYWFGIPSHLKKYIEDVYEYGIFYDFSGRYGEGGLLKGKK